MRNFVVASCLLVALGACATDDDDDDTVYPPPPTGPWTSISPVPFDPPIASDTILSPTLSADRLEMYVELPTGGIARRTRATTSDPFGPASNVSVLGNSYEPRLSPDGLTMYLTAYTQDADLEIFKSTRSSVAAQWTTPVRMPELGSLVPDHGASACGSGNQLVFSSYRGSVDSQEFRDGQVRALDELVAGSDPARATSPYVTADCKTLFFGAPGGGGTEIYVSHRDTADDLWGAPTLVSELSRLPLYRSVLWVSPDQHQLLLQEYSFDVDRNVQLYAVVEASR